MVELSDYVAVLLLCGYLASVLFSIFHVGDVGGEKGTRPHFRARSKEAILRLLAFRRRIVTAINRGNRACYDRLTVRCKRLWPMKQRNTRKQWYQLLQPNQQSKMEIGNMLKQRLRNSCYLFLLHCQERS